VYKITTPGRREISPALESQLKDAEELDETDVRYFKEEVSLIRKQIKSETSSEMVDPRYSSGNLNRPAAVQTSKLSMNVPQ
jgi:hypothetical protein